MSSVYHFLLFCFIICVFHLLLIFLFHTIPKGFFFVVVVVFLVWLTSPSDCSFHSSACYWAWLVCRYDLSLALLLHVFLYLLSWIVSEHSSLGMSLRVCITTIQGFLLLESPQRCQMISSIRTCMLHSLFPFKFLYSSFVVYI